MNVERQQALSEQVEALLVSRNLRNMKTLRAALEPGYFLRAATRMQTAKRVLIATGFPVDDTFETDGPLGAIALYRSLEAAGARCTLACADPLASCLSPDFTVLKLRAFNHEDARREAEENLELLQPDLIISIERPGLHRDGSYYNMRGEDISARCAIFDYYLTLATCSTIAIGDGGNEIGMGNLEDVVNALDIHAAATGCDELLVADVSNWGAYGLLAMLEALGGTPILRDVRHRETLDYLSRLGSVDGVTRENTLSEDGLPAAAGDALLGDLAALTAPFLDADHGS